MEDINNADRKGILLESGTNEFEIVEFSIGAVFYGINVAKVREVITKVAITKMPQMHQYVDGVFTLRGNVMPLVNLPRTLGVATGENSKNIIVTEINNYNIGFLVDNVSRIHRISWTEMEPAPEVGNSSMVVGVIKMADKIVLLLDFEKIIADINPEVNLKLTTVDEVDNSVREVRQNQKIVVAEDSPMLRELLIGTLHDAGYVNVQSFSNGQAAWDFLEELANKESDYNKRVNLLISDIEMPQMDGHRLLKLIRADKTIAELPVIFFSSLINEENRIKGQTLGANGQIAKPEINQLIDLVDELLNIAKDEV